MGAFEIRELAASEGHDDIARLLRGSFDLRDDELREWLERDAETTVLVARTDGRTIGSLHIRTHGQFIGGRRVEMASSDALAVDPTYRGVGVGSALMLASVRKMRELGQAIGVLRPASTRFHRRLGWELAGVWMERKVDASLLAAIPPAESLRVRRMRPGELDSVRGLYAREAGSTDGWIDRSDAGWIRRLFVGWEIWISETPDHAIAGYVLLRDDHEGESVLRIGEWVGTDHASWCALALAARSRAGDRAIVYTSPPEDPLLLILDEQEAPLHREMRWMNRLVDLERAMAMRGFGEHVDADVCVDVEDALAPWISGHWRLRVRHGRGSATRVAEGACRSACRSACRVGTGAMAALYTGYASTEMLQRTGSIQGSREALGTLDSMFGGRTPWMPDVI